MWILKGLVWAWSRSHIPDFVKVCGPTQLPRLQNDAKANDFEKVDAGLKYSLSGTLPITSGSSSLIEACHKSADQGLRTKLTIEYARRQYRPMRGSLGHEDSQ